MTTATQNAILVEKRTVSVALTKPHNPEAFYQKRAGLNVYPDYHRRIVQRANPTRAASPVTLQRFVLDRDSRDEDIEAGFGPSREFTETEVCWIVAEMIGKQEGGATGELNNSGDTNLFYTPPCVVHVHWHTAALWWTVRTWRRGDFVWSKGDFAFFRN